MSHLAWLIFILGWLIFTLYYVSSFFKWGVLTFSSYFWIRYNVLPILVMSPFASSDQNMEAVGNSIYIIRDYINEAFYLSVLGVVFVLVGMGLATFSSGKSAMFTFVEKGYAFWQTKPGVWISLVVIIFATMGLIALGVRPFEGRQFSFENTSLRPAINLYSVILPTITLSLLVYGFGHNRFFVFAGLMCSGLGLMIGTRGASIETLFIFVVCLIIAYRYKNLAAFTLSIAGFVTVAIVIGILRSTADGDNSVDILQTVSFQIFFGNNFSDFRDYAWILSGFDGRFYNGMTYLAGYMALVPSFISEFRNDFRMGIITSTLAGLDPQFHAGLRPTLFGEAYLNFGISGVVFIATLFGFYFGKLQMWVHDNLQPNRLGLRKVACGYIAFLFLFNAVFTPGFYYVYVVVAWLTGGIVMSYLLAAPLPWKKPAAAKS
ncbi:MULTISPECIES: O-antigen polymerase [unclassified Rhizobium]|uniref:O-antigen polymerase n=1 Tax=unclassified Rhizobium TaxID=2613769 RepID=UPI001782675B|nr:MULTISPECIES: O-antigen polymerase [unclassified Rhizobium]MBD8688579.1 oligosaccharide repeat unit polymerase [Rhizobium sp. CFBP 13644]MBD8692919.1 oligosaccharide repeat unit polymerase [Rhizobium sp. CFBP 13717]